MITDDQKLRLFRTALMNALESLEAIEELLDLKIGGCTNPVHSLERVEQCDHCTVVEQNARELLGLAIVEARAVVMVPVNPVVFVGDDPTLIGNHVVKLSDVDTSADETVDVAPIDPAQPIPEKPGLSATDAIELLNCGQPGSPMRRSALKQLNPEEL